MSGKNGNRVECSSECNKPTTPVTIGVTADKGTSDTPKEDAVLPNRYLGIKKNQKKNKTSKDVLEIKGKKCMRSIFIL